MAGRVQGRVIDVTPRTRMQSVALGIGLAIEITGWFLAAAAAIQGLGTALTVGLALVVILLGRRLRALSV